VVVGRISGVHGVRGWIKVYSFTSPRRRILDYSPWHVETAAGGRQFRVEEGRMQGKGVVARLEGITDRDQAGALVDAEIALERTQLPALPDGEYYWIDLIGLEVVTVSGQPLGAVTDLMETGANDVLVVRGERERLIPFLPDRVVQAVDRGAGRITVDWDPEF
jgi:16S rRNA processing protein RimM